MPRPPSCRGRTVRRCGPGVRLPAVIVMLLLTGVLAACSGGGSGSSPASTPLPPSEYVASVQAMLGPPGRLASLAVPRAADPPVGRIPRRSEVDELVREAADSLAVLRERPVEDTELARQRDAFAGAYQATVTHMRRVGRAMVQDDTDALRRDLPPLLNSMRGLSSAVSPPSSSSRSPG